MRTEIPFNAWSKERLRRGVKTATSRNKKYGRVGDWFRVDGQRYEITKHRRLHLREVREFFWQAEGCCSSQEFEDVWKEIHPRAGFQGEKKIWFHEFKPIPSEE